MGLADHLPLAHDRLMRVGARLPPRTRTVLSAKTALWRRRIFPLGFKETYINEALEDATRPSLYLEIGVAAGNCIRSVRADRKIGIDPERQATMEALRPGEEFFEMTSEKFFADVAGEVLGTGSVDAALVDGLHEFRQTLRDILHLERYMRPGGLIIVHDCNPVSASQAADDAVSGSGWQGDVWKIAEYLRDERQDLRFVTVDTDHGVGLLTGPWGKKDLPDEVSLDTYKSLGYEYLDRDRQRVLNLVAPNHLRDLLPLPGRPL